MMGFYSILSIAMSPTKGTKIGASTTMITQLVGTAVVFLPYIADALDNNPANI